MNVVILPSGVAISMVWSIMVRCPCGSLLRDDGKETAGRQGVPLNSAAPIAIVEFTRHSTDRRDVP